MYSELFDALGGGGAAAMGGPRGASARQEPQPLISFKAGKMEMTQQENGKYWCVPDTRRAKVQLRYNSEDALLWEWYDRREKAVSDTIRITSPVALKKVTNVSSLQEPEADPMDDADVDAVPMANDRTNTRTIEDDDNPCREVYYWKLDNEWKMLWLQDREIEEGLVGKINDILKHPTKPAESESAEQGVATRSSSSNAGATATANASRSAGAGADTATTGADSSGTSASPAPTAASASATATTQQVDALSSILENLGMPQGGETEGSAAGTATASDAATTTTTATAVAVPASAPSGAGVLTLADLQGAMAGLQQQAAQQQQQRRPVGLQEVVTPQAITDLLTQEGVRNRLMEQLPEGQRSAAHLEENLRSPQMQSTLRSLTAALMPDDNGSLDGYHSVLANFQLDASAGQRVLVESNNPIEAFLAAVLASVKEEKATEGSEESKAGDGDGDGDEMKD